MRQTHVYPFYNDQHRLYVLEAAWTRYSRRVQKEVDILVIDDHSATPIKPMGAGCKRFLKVCRIKEDIQNNIPGAYNLGFHLAETDWVLYTASDHVFQPEMMERLCERQLMPDESYIFSKERITTNKLAKRRTRPHTSTRLMEKRVWKKMGGFDEDFAGPERYGYFEQMFQDRVREITTEVLMGDVVQTDYCHDVLGGAARYGKKWLRENRILRAHKTDNKLPPGPMLNFTWEQTWP